MKTIILPSTQFFRRIIGRNSQDEASKVRLSLNIPVIPFYASRALSEINLISERCVGDATRRSLQFLLTTLPKDPRVGACVVWSYRSSIPNSITLLYLQRCTRVCLTCERPTVVCLATGPSLRPFPLNESPPIGNYLLAIQIVIIAINNGKYVAHPDAFRVMSYDNELR